MAAFAFSLTIFAMLFATAFTGNSTKPGGFYYSGATPIKGQYIVVLKPDAPLDEVVNRYHEGLPSEKVFNISDFQGYVAKFDSDVIDNLAEDPRIAYIEQDGIARIFQTSCDRLERMSEYFLPRISSSQPSNVYRFDATAGANTNIYVIDSGIRLSHAEYRGRAFHAANFVANESPEDSNGHGTCVSGIAAGRVYGVAKQATIYSVKVFGSTGEGQFSLIVSAISWVINHAKTTGKLSVINMSLGGGFSRAINDAVAAAYRAGIPVIVAAGNEHQDASYVSPASSPYAFTVGASDAYNQLASYSNYGQVLNIIAPGSDVKCASASSDTGFTYMSGTSMATPVVAGVAALQAARTGSSSPNLLYRWLKSASFKSIVNGVPFGTTNDLVSNGCT